MEVSTVIIENFLDNPDVVRQSVLGIPFERTGPFPGLRSERADDDYVNYTKTKIEISCNLNIKEFKQDSHTFQICQEGAETWIHHDDTEWAGVLYLTPDAPISAGTAIYRHKETGIYKGPSNVPNTNIEDWEIITMIGNIYNRLVLYNGDMYHRSLLSGFGNSLETARMTQVFFFNTDK
jgi:hypothetical protein